MQFRNRYLLHRLIKQKRIYQNDKIVMIVHCALFVLKHQSCKVCCSGQHTGHIRECQKKGKHLSKIYQRNKQLWNLARKVQTYNLSFSRQNPHLMFESFLEGELQNGHWLYSRAWFVMCSCRLGTIHLRRRHVPMVQRSQYIMIKNPLHKHFAGMPMVGGRGQKWWKFADILNGWSLTKYCSDLSLFE